MADLIQGAFAVSLAILAAAAPASGAAGAAPIHLVAEKVGEGVRLQVLGAAREPFEGSYALEVTTDAAAGKNRSTQRGTARLQPGVPVTLVTLTLGNVRSGTWSAKLRVEPSGGSPYEEHQGSNASN